MKKLGLVGGVGPESTLVYYKRINDEYRQRAEKTAISGDNPPMVIDSLNLADAYNLSVREDWGNFAELFIRSIRTLHGAGAEFAAISANTAHIVYDEIQAKSPIPVIGIIDEACKFMKAKGCEKVVVFGTWFTMVSDMYPKACAKYGIQAIMPSEEDRHRIHNIIFPNLEAGIVLEEDKKTMLEIAERTLESHQADALVLGCTELQLIIKENDLDTLLIDTTETHIEAIVREILG
ncbi:MAG: amino acid racemase [Clostridiales bacterium]|nr:amino acid racemase [Clostridiales bacterium]